QWLPVLPNNGPPSKSGSMYRYWPPTLANTRQSTGRQIWLFWLKQNASLCKTLNCFSDTLKVRTAGVAGGAGTSSHPSRMLLAKKLALVPANGRMTRRRVGCAGTEGQVVPVWAWSCGGGGVESSMRQKIGSTVTQTVLSLPPHVCEGSSLKWSTVRHCSEASGTGGVTGKVPFTWGGPKKSKP